MTKNSVKKIFVSIIICIAITIPISTSGSDTINAYIANYRLYYRTGRSVNGLMEYPMLCYNDKAYIAITDMAKIINRNALYTEHENHIYLNRAREDYENKALIKNDSMALAIGKIILEEYFCDRLRENSVFYVQYVSHYAEKEDNHYIVRVVFDPPSDEEIRKIKKEALGNENFNDETFIFLYSDAELKIDPMDGAVYEINLRKDKSNITLDNWEAFDWAG